MSTPTPRTDAAAGLPSNDWDKTAQLLFEESQKLERELATERARLDWLEGNAGDMHRYNSFKYIWFSHQNLRDAIDAAMKEGA